MACVSCQVSGVRCELTGVKFFFYKLVEGLLSTGPPLSSFLVGMEVMVVRMMLFLNKRIAEDDSLKWQQKKTTQSVSHGLCRGHMDIVH